MNISPFQLQYILDGDKKNYDNTLNYYIIENKIYLYNYKITYTIMS